jgi:hypothetical protein
MIIYAGIHEKTALRPNTHNVIIYGIYGRTPSSGGARRPIDVEMPS